MICTRLPGGGFVCRSGRRPSCSGCGKPGATLQCDYPLTGPKAGKTCDRWLCDKCATHVGPDRDYCPPHQALDTRLRAAGTQAAPAETPQGSIQATVDAVAAGAGASSPPAAVQDQQLRLL